MPGRKCFSGTVVDRDHNTTVGGRFWVEASLHVRGTTELVEEGDFRGL
jgi:hypothetical protein